MVKFGRHQKFFVEHENPDCFLVPYNDVKTKIEETNITADDFEAQWRSYLHQARDQFDVSSQRLWRNVFASLHAVEDARGAPPEKALVLFIEHASSPKQVQELLDEFKSIHTTALMNGEALRKLVKKFDKQKSNKTDSVNNGDDSPSIPTLSCKLLPEVYAANFVVSLCALLQFTELLRSELGLGDYATTPTAGESKDLQNCVASVEPNDIIMESPPPVTTIIANGNTHISDPVVIPPLSEPGPELPFTMLTNADRKDSYAEHNELVDRRRQELLWLRHSVQIIAKRNLLHNLVAHRGFHSPKDRSDRRPLENSLQAYETAWTSGIHLCECDIALTKDEHLILAHDSDFSRLALDTSCEKSRRNVRDLTFQEIMSVALSSGSRPPLLLDVLQSAQAIGGQSQLIIEIKPGNREAASALARLFAQHPHLMARVAVCMSFDSFAMHALREELDAWLGPAADSDEQTTNGGNRMGKKVSNSHRRCYSMGIFPSPAALTRPPSTADHNNSDPRLEQSSASAHKLKSYQRPKLLVLTVCDDPRRDVELQVSVTDEDIYEKIHGWIKGRLDGVFMQFEPEMLTTDGARVLNKLARRQHVGVWGHNSRDPDDYDTLVKLVKNGHVAFVNTDLPREFFQHEGLPSVPQSQNSSVASSEAST